MPYREPVTPDFLRAQTRVLVLEKRRKRMKKKNEKEKFSKK